MLGYSLFSGCRAPHNEEWGMHQQQRVIVVGWRVLLTVAITPCLYSCGSYESVEHHDADARVRQGAWSSVIPLPAEGVNSVLLPSGKVMLWGVSGHPWGEYNQSNIVLWDVETGGITEIPHPDGGATAWDGPGTEWLHYAGHAQLPNGNVLIAGGEGPDETEGTTGTYEFDWQTETLTRVGDMTHPRFGPTLTALPDGRILAHAGWIDRDWGAYDAGEAGVGYTAPVAEIWDGTSWNEIGDSNTEASFTPSQFIAPDGRLFRSGPEPLSDWFDLSTGTYTDGPTPLDRPKSSAVMYQEGRILVAAGESSKGNTPGNDAHTIDLNQGSPTWSKVSSLTHARKSHHSVLLPDGTVFVVGGTNSKEWLGKYDEHVLTPELWDPATDTWSALPDHAEPRAVFSTALLLLDGRVAVMGGGYDGGPDPNAFGDTHQRHAEIYSPGYMFQSRPTIDSAPASVAYGVDFFVGTRDGASIASVVWIRLGSAMCRFNMGQLVNNLAFVPTTEALTVSAPSSSTLTPPGYWALYIVDDNGVPSVGVPIQVTVAAPVCGDGTCSA